MLTKADEEKLVELLAAQADINDANKRMHSALCALRSLFPNGGFRYFVVNGYYIKLYKGMNTDVTVEECQKVEPSLR